MSLFYSDQKRQATSETSSHRPSRMCIAECGELSSGLCSPFLFPTQTRHSLSCLCFGLLMLGETNFGLCAVLLLGSLSCSARKNPWPSRRLNKPRRKEAAWTGAALMDHRKESSWLERRQYCVLYMKQEGAWFGDSRHHTGSCVPHWLQEWREPRSLGERLSISEQLRFIDIYSPFRCQYPIWMSV